MSAFNRLLGLVADIFILDFSDFSQIIRVESESREERQQLSRMGRPLRIMAHKIMRLNTGIAGIIREIGNNQLSADDINILYTIEQLSKQFRNLIPSLNHSNYDDGLDVLDRTQISDDDTTRRILPIQSMLNNFIAICKRRSNLNQVTPPDIEAAAAQRATIAIADRRRAMAELQRELERSAIEMGSPIRSQDIEQLVSFNASLAARAPANAAPGLAGVAPSPDYPPRSPDYPPPRSPGYPPSLQLNPHAEPFAAAAAQPSIERVRNEDERVNFNRLILQHPNPSNEFVCPITQEIMFDPVVALDGRTYERKAIERWLEKNSNSPMTKQPINDKTLRTNWTIRSAIERFLDGSLVKDMVGDSIEMLMKKINDGNDEDKKINKKDALVLLYENDFNVDEAFKDGELVDTLMKKINDGKDDDKKINRKDALVLLYEMLYTLMNKINAGKEDKKKINKKDALVLLYENDFNAQKAYDAYMMTQGGRKGGTRRNLRKKPRNQRKRYTKKRK